MRSSLAWWLVCTIVAVAALAVGYAAYVLREDERIERRAAVLAQGDPQRGPDAMLRYGCGGCHDIPGVRGARGLAAPSLARFGVRAYIAGELRNTPDNLVQWIAHPHGIEPKTAMPDMGVGDRDAHDIAAYLYTLQ
ncbi:MAG TPA: c-type cytochrome [Rudaea sp.]|jgi:cytochrome c1|nr:c-type cytochrome [Rudaea sp.]